MTELIVPPIFLHLDDDELEDILIDAMFNVQDYDTGLGDFARAIIRRLQKEREAAITLDSFPPEAHNLMITRSWRKDTGLTFRPEFSIVSVDPVTGREHGRVYRQLSLQAALDALAAKLDIKAPGD